jgi:hypothetical protein
VFPKGEKRFDFEEKQHFRDFFFFFFFFSHFSVKRYGRGNDESWRRQSAGSKS